MKNKISKKKEKKKKESKNSNMPSWILDEGNERETPYTDEELDLLVDGFIQSNMDINMLKDLLDKFDAIVKSNFEAEKAPIYC